VTAAIPTASASAHRTQTWLLTLEWFSLLAGMLLCMPTKGYYPGLFLALLLLAVSWVARWMRIRRLTRSTPLDIPLLLFLLSLLISYFASPEPATAFTRLTLFLAAFSFFYALTNSPLHCLYLISHLLIVALVFAGLFLISQYDWSVEISRSPLNNLIGVQLNRLIPDMKLSLPSWNVLRNILASLLSLSLPLLTLQLYRAFSQVKKSNKSLHDQLQGRLKLYLLISLAFLFLLDLLLTESRAPWLAYAVLLALVVWWWLSQRLGKRTRFSQRIIFLAGCLLGFLLLLGFINFLSLNNQLIALLPGPDTFTGRLEISTQSSYLAGDTPYSGGGLGAFTALYSFYIRVTPYNAFTSEDTGNDIYHYFLVEQGWLGLISLILLLVIPIYIGLVQLNRPEIVDNGLVAAGVAGVGIIILRGFVHAILGASRAIPFLLLPAGLIFAGLGSAPLGLFSTISSKQFQLTRRRILVLIVPILLLLAYLLFAPAPRSAWYANLGAIRMARIQLTGWPTEAWEDGSSLPALVPAEVLFQKSLDLNPHNRTANHRLGLISLLRQDFNTAARFLESAYAANPQHRGVIKSLGYILVWKGEFERATKLLRMIPEAAEELGFYIYWWQGLDRHDLSKRAAEARARLLASP
jgi:O-antigen ligase